MARNFRRHRATHAPIADLNVTNLIDLGFMLLIIFMLVANPALQQEQTIPLKLPSESKSPQQKADKDTKFHTVSIDARLRYYLDNERTALTLPQLKSKLNAYAGAKEKTVIRIRADEDVPYGKFMQVMDELKKLDLTSVTLDTQASP